MSLMLDGNFIDRLLFPQDFQDDLKFELRCVVLSCFLGPLYHGADCGKSISAILHRTQGISVSMSDRLSGEKREHRSNLAPNIFMEMNAESDCILGGI